ncbi:alcohol dehydrogenase, partial [Photobacterium profundum]
MSHCWNNVLIKPTNTIRDALEIINNEALRVVLVVDHHEHLQGVVTDGDIRRGLLNNLALTAEITQVMNSNPMTADVNTPRDELIAIMKSNGILSLPLVDDENRVVGLETLHHLFEKTIHQNPVFLMAGGFGTRLRPLTDTCPKPMLKIGNKPILETVIR